MKFSRTASANWMGSGRDGKGSLTTQSETLNQTPYSFHTRFENGKGTNPEELIGAAHAGCFTMQLSFLLGRAEFTPTRLDTDAKVVFEDGNIIRIELTLVGKVEGIEEEQFQQIAQEAKEICPVSKLLDTDIQLIASLEE